MEETQNAGKSFAGDKKFVKRCFVPCTIKQILNAKRSEDDLMDLDG